LEPPLCVVSSSIIRVYIILVWNIISGSSNFDNCFYLCLILISISHLKALFITTTTTTTTITTTTTTIVIIVVVVVLLLFIIYTINLHVVRHWSRRVIYYFDTPALGRRHQFFYRVIVFVLFFVKIHLI
jgi:uncharacterized membrane protein